MITRSARRSGGARHEVHVLDRRAAPGVPLRGRRGDHRPQPRRHSGCAPDHARWSASARRPRRRRRRCPGRARAARLLGPGLRPARAWPRCSTASGARPARAGGWPATSRSIPPSDTAGRGARARSRAGRAARARRRRGRRAHTGRPARRAPVAAQVVPHDADAPPASSATCGSHMASVEPSELMRTSAGVSRAPRARARRRWVSAARCRARRALGRRTPGALPRCPGGSIARAASARDRSRERPPRNGRPESARRARGAAPSRGRRRRAATRSASSRR